MAAVLLPATMAFSTSAVSFSLTYLDRFKIKDDDERVAEPSGLAVSKEGDALWTVSDDRKSVFKISLEGDPLNRQSFKIGEEDLEGIALDPTTDSLVVVKEETNEILEVSLASKAVVARHALSAMAGFGDIERHFPDGDDKGLEGITFDQSRGTFFVLKEADPALVIEISKDLGSILDAHVLDASKGFVDDDVDIGKIDVSGLEYDQTRSPFWIVSDQARRLYLYDWDLDRVIQSAALGYEKDGDFREIEKAEGVAIDPRRHRLYVVSDEESRLYVFDLR
jgi:uncharacterized protein YjiK